MKYIFKKKVERIFGPKKYLGEKILDPKKFEAQKMFEPIWASFAVFGPVWNNLAQSGPVVKKEYFALEQCHIWKPWVPFLV